MADDQLLKTVRITDNIKVEVYQQGRRRKYALFNDEDKTKSEKYDVAMSDDDVIKESLLEYGRLQKSKGKISGQMPQFYYKVIQDPYKDPMPKRTYGGGTASPYYINNGCSINILWYGAIPNPAFTLGTYSTPFDAEDAPNAPERLLYDQQLTSSVDDATNRDTLPKSTWVVAGTFSSHPGSSIVYGPDFRDGSYVNKKVVTVNFPDGVKEKGEYLVWTNLGLQYNTTTGVELQNFKDDWKDADILKHVIQDFQGKVCHLYGLLNSEYDLKLCNPDSGSCSIIPYKSPLDGPTNDQIIAQQTPGVTQSTPKIKFTIDGLGDDIQVKAKEDLPEFKIWAGSIPKTKAKDGDSVDDYELGEEYTETDAVITEEQQIQLDLQVYLTQGDSEGTEDVSSGTTTTGGGVNTNGTNAGGTGVRRFQQQLTIRGRVVKNGEIPNDLLAKVDFGGYLLEKHAAAKFSALNKAFKEKFGKNFTISGPYRPFNVSNSIFDWDYFDKTGKGRKIGTNGGTAAAKPGTSKHGWGQAMDIGGFGNGPGNVYFDWMEQNAKKYGWINPAWAKKPGAGYEPWHWEYIGDDLFAA